MLHIRKQQDVVLKICLPTKSNDHSLISSRLPYRLDAFPYYFVLEAAGLQLQQCGPIYFSTLATLPCLATALPFASIVTRVTMWPQP